MKKKIIMISYSHKNKRLVENICTCLRRKLDPLEHQLWIDTEQMQTGIDLKIQMHQAVQDSDVVVLMLSQDYLKSKNCNFESELAAILRKKILPVYLDNCEKNNSNGTVYIRHTDVETTAIS